MGFPAQGEAPSRRPALGVLPTGAGPWGIRGPSLRGSVRGGARLRLGGSGARREGAPATLQLGRQRGREAPHRRGAPAAEPPAQRAPRASSPCVQPPPGVSVRGGGDGGISKRGVRSSRSEAESGWRGPQAAARRASEGASEQASRERRRRQHRGHGALAPAAAANAAVTASARAQRGPGPRQRRPLRCLLEPQQPQVSWT